MRAKPPYLLFVPSVSFLGQIISYRAQCFRSFHVQVLLISVLSNLFAAELSQWLSDIQPNISHNYPLEFNNLLIELLWAVDNCDYLLLIIKVFSTSVYYTGRTRVLSLTFA